MNAPLVPSAPPNNQAFISSPGNRLRPAEAGRRRRRAPRGGAHRGGREDQPLRPPMIETSGMNRAMTIVPTTTAKKMISNGSMIEVMAATALSTSSS